GVDDRGDVAHELGERAVALGVAGVEAPGVVDEAARSVAAAFARRRGHALQADGDDAGVGLGRLAARERLAQLFGDHLRLPLVLLRLFLRRRLRLRLALDRAARIVDERLLGARPRARRRIGRRGGLR